MSIYIHYIYKITNTISNKCYIGKTAYLEKRWYKHSSLNNVSYISNSIKKYGVENFKFEVLEAIQFYFQPTKKDIRLYVDSREIHFTTKFNSYAYSASGHGYNCTKGGDGGDTSKSPKYKESMKVRVNKGWHPNAIAKAHSEESRFKKSVSMKGKNTCPVCCDGVTYPSVQAAQSNYPGISIRKRLDNPKYPNFQRLRERTERTRRK